MDRRTPRHSRLCFDFHELSKREGSDAAEASLAGAALNGRTARYGDVLSPANSVSLAGNWSNFIKFLAQPVDGSP